MHKDFLANTSTRFRDVALNNSKSGDEKSGSHRLPCIAVALLKYVWKPAHVVVEHLTLTTIELLKPPPLFCGVFSAMRFSYKSVSEVEQ